jgi:hypothetical protein
VTAFQDVARNLGINFIVVPRIHNKADAIEAARNFLSTTWIDEEHCVQGIRCLDSYAKAWDETHAPISQSRSITGQATEPTF